ncbi:unnamed protein product [Calypogeia fissa]
MDRRRQVAGDAEDHVALLEGDTDFPASPDRDRIRLTRRKESRPRKVRWRFVGVMLVGVVSVVSTVLSIVSIVTLERSGVSLPARAPRERMVSKIAFGSCTAYDYSPQPIWVHGVIPSDPDAWIWVGDMAYMDEPRVNCQALPSHAHCNCTSDWLHQAPYTCMAGNHDHALSRVQAQLSNPDYAQFLAFMCPDHRAKGLFPPTGPDPSICPRRIFGTYDDHDYSWTNGNYRLPQKDRLKQIFLDAIGEPNSSPRRNRGRGIEWKYTLNEDRPGQEIDIFLLDERYNRGTLPCHTRREFCKAVLAIANHPKHAWCEDFLHGGDLGMGSCCSKDDEIFYGWCLQENNKENILYPEACDPSSHLFGSRSFVVDSDGQLVEASGSDVVDGRGESPFCEVLGKDQRLWLQESLALSNAPVKLVVSSSVLLGNPKPQMCENEGTVRTNMTCLCTGDDWECYKPAQLHLLHLLSRTSGCVAILTGDMHFSDVKVLRPSKQAYSQYYESVDFSYPLFQVMASGLTTSTGANYSCDGWTRDPVGLRDHEECDFVRGPSFGMIEVEWKALDPIIRFQVRDGKNGAIKLESNLTLSSCGLKASS